MEPAWCFSSEVDTGWREDDAAERLAGVARLEPAEPLYLRRPDARVPGKPKRVTP